MRRSNLVASIIVSGALLWGAEAKGEATLAGTVKNAAGQPLPGLALMEIGELHGNVWGPGTLVDERGEFKIEVPKGGQYGLHVYSGGYLYHPEAVLLEEGKTVRVTVTLIPEGTRANDPIIKRLGFFPWEGNQGTTTYAKLDVADPNDALGPQGLARNARTGRGYALDPPRQVRNLKEDFPQGVYQLPVDTSKAPIEPKDWYFVIADHQCNTTDILSYPHQPQPPRVVRVIMGARPVSADTGRDLFQLYCTRCHYSDRTDTKTGPGLRGLFGRETLPSSNTPVSEDNVKHQIFTGSRPEVKGDRMPPFGHLPPGDIQSLLLFLRTL
ncbi:MAG: c-type cytochrome [candidate division NC10 bacterium]|nr:c-type cytochrome [candidate division NC10 bacterium]